MALISTVRTTALQAFADSVQQEISGLGSLEEAAQCYTTKLYQEFRESVVLARLFATVSYQQLPFENKIFVDHLARKKGLGHELHDQTPVLSLLGTSGEEPGWNERRNSLGHMGIPLISAAFIDCAPMMSRLLHQLGLGLDWIDQGDTHIVKRTMGSISGLFFVPDAASEKDHEGQNIIQAQDFVSRYSVKTVFGFGGGYLESSTFNTTIIFLRETLDENKARQTAAALSFFKTATVELAKHNIFADPAKVSSSS
ncbi:hypothetical protein ACFL3F_00630 [Planctomycetota bacterium]